MKNIFLFFFFLNSLQASSKSHSPPYCFSFSHISNLHCLKNPLSKKIISSSFKKIIYSWILFYCLTHSALKKNLTEPPVSDSCNCLTKWLYQRLLKETSQPFNKQNIQQKTKYLIKNLRQAPLQDAAILINHVLFNLSVHIKGKNFSATSQFINTFLSSLTEENSFPLLYIHSENNLIQLFAFPRLIQQALLQAEKIRKTQCFLYKKNLKERNEKITLNFSSFMKGKQHLFSYNNDKKRMLLEPEFIERYFPYHIACMKKNEEIIFEKNRYPFLIHLGNLAYELYS